MGNLIFITGGVRSGKSDFAVTRAAAAGDQVCFIATCQPLDDEMEHRVRKHRENRPSSWQTIEEQLDIAAALGKVSAGTKAVIIDCLTLLVSNMTFAQLSDDDIEHRIGLMLKAIENVPFEVIVVTNELGWGIVPENELARRFRDTAGRVNQMAARAAREAYLMVAGIPVQLK